MDDLQFSQLFWIHVSVSLPKIHSLHNSFTFMQTEYILFLPFAIMLIPLCFFIQNKKTMIELKRKNYQTWNKKGLIVENKWHRFNVTVCVTTCKTILYIFRLQMNLKTKKEFISISINKAKTWQSCFCKLTKCDKEISQNTSTSALRILQTNVS